MCKKTGASRRIMALLLAVAMAVGGVPAAALAEAIESDEVPIQVLEDQASVENESDRESSSAREAAREEESISEEDAPEEEHAINPNREESAELAGSQSSMANQFDMGTSELKQDVNDANPDITLSVQSAAHTRDEAVAWANSQNGKALDFDGNYGAQCVDLTCYYYNYLGQATPWGNANQYVYGGSFCPSGWSYQSSPQPGDIAVWTTGDFGHVAIVTEIRGSQMVIMEQNYRGQQYCAPRLCGMNAQTYIRPDWPASDREPVGMVASCQCVGPHLLRVCGWAYDPDAPNDSIRFHVYVGGNSGSGARGYATDAVGNALLANHQYRSQGRSEFDYTLYVEETGNQPIYIYAINHEEGGNNPELSGSGVVVNITNDTTPPVISNVRVTDVSPSGYTVSCNVTDNDKVDRVQFPTWTAHVVDGTDQDDIASEWWTNPAVRGTRNGDTWTFRVNVSDHGYEQGMYWTHIYAYDACGNMAFSDIPGAECVYRYGPDATVANGTYKLLSAADTRYALDVAGMSTEPEANVQVYERNESSAQCWKLTRNDDGTYTIASACSNLVLDSWCATYQSGASIVQYVDNGGDNQRWYIQEYGDAHTLLSASIPTCSSTCGD